MGSIMMKTTIKTTIRISVSMLLVLSLLLTGCGGKVQKKQSGSVTEQKPYVYVPEYHNIEADYISPNQTVITDDMLYYIENTYIEGTADTPGKMISNLVSINISDQNVQKVDLGLNENTTVSALTQSPNGDLKAIFVTYMSEAQTNQEGNAAAEDGKAAGETAADAAPAAEGDKAAEDTAAEKDKAADSSSADGITDGNDTVVITEGGNSSTRYFVNSSGGTAIMSSAAPYNPEEMMTETKVEIVTINKDGSLGESFAAPIEKDDSQMGINAILIDQSGKYLIQTGQKIYILKEDGSIYKVIEVENWIDNFFKSADGTIYATYYGNEGMEAHPVDVEGGKFGDALTQLKMGYGNLRFGSGAKSIESDFFYSRDNSVYTYKMGEEGPTELFTWLDSDIDYNNLSAFGVLSDGRIFCLMSGGMESKSEIIYLTKKKSSEVPQKQILTLGTLYMSNNIRRMTIDFNKKNLEYRIQVKEYGNYDEDYLEIMKRMNSEIASGNVPDIININGLSFQTYAVKGIFEDLNPYFEKDNEIKKENFVENAINLYSMDDKLYAIFPSFLISTVVGSSDVFGERSKISIDEMIEMQKQLPKDKELYGYATKDTVLRKALTMDMDRYVDWKTGECRFNSDDFMRTLEFANLFNKEFKEYDSDVESKILDGTVLLMDRTISSVQDYQMYEALLGGKVSFVGYPTNHENGSFLTTYDDTMAISSKSANKDAAWQFIKGFLSDEFQAPKTGYFWGFPISKKALDATFEEAMKEEYYTDENNEQVRSAKMNWGIGNLNMEIFAANQKQVDTIKGLINSVTAKDQINEELFNIILEEAAPFFEGQKNAKAVADIIQSRLQIYVSENR